MKDENKKADYAIWVVFIFSMVVLLWGTTACKRVYVPVVEKHTKDSARVEHRVDTFLLHTHDSVVVQMPCSDSIEVAYVERWHTNTEYKSREVHDTIRTERVDSIPYVQEVPGPEVVRNSGFAKFCIWYFWLTLLAALATIALKVYWRIR